MSSLGIAYSNVVRERDNARHNAELFKGRLNTLVSRLKQFEPMPEGTWENDPYVREYKLGFQAGWNGAVSDIRDLLRGLDL